MVKTTRRRALSTVVADPGFRTALAPDEPVILNRPHAAREQHPRQPHGVSCVIDGDDRNDGGK